MQRTTKVLLASAAAAATLAAWPPARAGGPPKAAVLAPADRLLLSKPASRQDRGFVDFDLELFAGWQAASGVAFTALPGAKRLRAVALRETRAEDLGLAWVRTVRSHCDAEQWMRHVNAFGELGAAFGSRRRFAAGDSFELHLVPGEGVHMLINGTVVRRNLGDAEFFALLVRGWGPDAVPKG